MANINLQCQCDRCGHVWMHRRQGTSPKCPDCGCPYWSKPNSEERRKRELDWVAGHLTTHRATCGRELTVTEGTTEPLESVTVTLSCAACGLELHASFAPAELAAGSDQDELARLFGRLERRATN